MAKEFNNLTNVQSWSSIEENDFDFSFLDSYTKKMVFKGGKVYNQEQSIVNSASIISKYNSNEKELIFDYSKTQNNKEKLEEAENKIKIKPKGSRRWGFGQADIRGSNKGINSTTYLGQGNSPIKEDKKGWIATKVSQIGSKFIKKDKDTKQTNNWMSPDLKKTANISYNNKEQQTKIKVKNRQRIANSLFAANEDLFVSSKYVRP